MKMGEQLVAGMSTDWDPAAYTDSFKLQILELVAAKAKAGEVESVTPVAREAEPASATVYDLTALLKRSLEQGGRSAQPAAAGKKPGRATQAKSTAKPARKAPARKKSA